MGGPKGPQAWDPRGPGLQGPCASLSRSGLSQNQLCDFGQAGRAIPDCSFLLCEMGGMKDLPPGDATYQTPPGDGRQSGLGSCGARAAAAFAAHLRATTGTPPHPTPTPPAGTKPAARGKGALSEVFPSGPHGGLPRRAPSRRPVPPQRPPSRLRPGQRTQCRPRSLPARLPFPQVGGNGWGLRAQPRPGRFRAAELR